MADLLIQGGEVLDPGQGLRGRLSIAVSQEKISQMASHIDPREAQRVVDVGGKVVVPGLIDLHAHVYAGVRTVGVNENCLMPEITQQADIDVEGTIRCVEQNKPTVLGVKLRMAGPVLDVFGIEAAKLAKRAARETHTRLMVHIGDSREGCPEANRLTQQLLAEVLEPGNIVTHLCTHHTGGVMRQDGTVIPELLDAMQAGVVLDPGHGRNNFKFDIAPRQLDQGVVPDTISTDACWSVALPITTPS